MRRITVIVLLLVLVVTARALAGLERYSNLVVADPGGRTTAPRAGVRITYLGTNAYLFETHGTTLLVDPYFSRMSLLCTALDLSAAPQPALIARYLPACRIDAILATHGHIDHLLDVPPIMRTTRAKAIVSRTSARLLESCGVASARCMPVGSGRLVRIGGATVHVFAATHDRLLGHVPFDTPPRRLPPRRVSDWVCGEPLAFLIEMGGQRIYLEAGGQAGATPAIRGPVDLAILGVALPDARARFPGMLAALQPRYVLPSHQDDFFRPLEQGFVFGPLTDFPAVQRTFDAQHARTRMILLDYQKPWTLR